MFVETDADRQQAQRVLNVLTAWALGNENSSVYRQDIVIGNPAAGQFSIDAVPAGYSVARQPVVTVGGYGLNLPTVLLIGAVILLVMRK